MERKYRADCIVFITSELVQSSKAAGVCLKLSFCEKARIGFRCDIATGTVSVEVHLKKNLFFVEYTVCTDQFTIEVGNLKQT